MGQEIIRLEHPIDVMYLIHSALRTEAAELEESIRRLESEDSLQLIHLDFTKWAAALMFHAEQEDQYMTPLLADCEPARDGEREHAGLVERLEDVVRVLDEEIGKTKLIARTQRHLFGAVVALRIAQDDHLESEEAFVLPVVWERLDETQQLDIARYLLIDENSANRRWSLDWMTQRLNPAEREALVGLDALCQ